MKALWWSRKSHATGRARHERKCVLHLRRSEIEIGNVDDVAALTILRVPHDLLDVVHRRDGSLDGFELAKHVNQRMLRNPGGDHVIYFACVTQSSFCSGKTRIVSERISARQPHD